MKDNSSKHCVTPKTFRYVAFTGSNEHKYIPGVHYYKYIEVSGDIAQKSYVALHADAVDLPRDVLVEVRASTLRLVQIQVSVGFCCLYGQVRRHLKILHVRLPNHTSVFSIQYYFLMKQKFISRNLE